MQPRKQELVNSEPRVLIGFIVVGREPPASPLVRYRLIGGVVLQVVAAAEAPAMSAKGLWLPNFVEDAQEQQSAPEFPCKQ